MDESDCEGNFLEGERSGEDVEKEDDSSSNPDDEHGNPNDEHGNSVDEHGNTISCIFLIDLVILFVFGLIFTYLLCFL